MKTPKESKHQLGEAYQAAAILKRLYRHPLSKVKQAKYLETLRKTDGNVFAALSDANLKYQTVLRWRRYDESFRAAELECCDPDEFLQNSYLESMRANYGNRSKARMELGLEKAVVEEWMRDPDFERREQEIYEWFVDEANEQNTRLIVGADSSVRNPEHLRWALPKIDKRWEEKPKVLEHRYGGSVTVKDTRERIKELLRPEDVVDGELA